MLFDTTVMCDSGARLSSIHLLPKAVKESKGRTLHSFGNLGLVQQSTGLLSTCATVVDHVVDAQNKFVLSPTKPARSQIAFFSFQSSDHPSLFLTGGAFARKPNPSSWSATPIAYETPRMAQHKLRTAKRRFAPKSENSETCPGVRSWSYPHAIP